MEIDIFPNEQKGFKREFFGCKYQLLINKVIYATNDTNSSR